MSNTRREWVREADGLCIQVEATPYQARVYLGHLNQAVECVVHLHPALNAPERHKAESIKLAEFIARATGAEERTV